MGIDKEGNKKDSFEPGIDLIGKVTVFAEGCRGHLGKQLIKNLNLIKEKTLNNMELVLKKFGK
jgi:electron-transferring-flavoprotein dehydrogenase